MNIIPWIFGGVAAQLAAWGGLWFRTPREGSPGLWALFVGFTVLAVLIWWYLLARLLVGAGLLSSTGILGTTIGRAFDFVENAIPEVKWG